MRRRGSLLLLFLVVALVIAGVAVFQWTGSAYNAAGPHEQVVRVEVASGPSVRGVLNQLGKRGVVANPQAVALYLRAHLLHPKIKAGTYDIPAHATPAAILKMFEQGLVVLEQLTIVEGSTFADLRRALEKHA